MKHLTYANMTVFSDQGHPTSLTTAKAGVMMMTAELFQVSGLLLGIRQLATERG